MTPLDALDPGPDGAFPNIPRLPNGEVDPIRFPTGRRTQRQRDPLTSRRVVIDVTPAVDDQALPPIP